MRETIGMLLVVLFMLAGTAFAYMEGSPMMGVVENSEAQIKGSQEGCGMSTETKGDFIYGRNSKGMMISGTGCGMIGHGTGAGMMGMIHNMMGTPTGCAMMGAVVPSMLFSRKYQKFLDETVELRRQLHQKQFEYFEALRKPDTTAEAIAKIYKEIYELQRRISEKLPRAESSHHCGHSH